MSAIKTWMEKATPAECQQLATLAKTSVAHLGQLKGGHRNIGTDLARRLAPAIRQLHESNPALPLLTLAQLCPKAYGELA